MTTMPRFYVDPRLLSDDVIELSPKESHHAIDVFRLKEGDAVELFDGRGRNCQGQVLGIRQGRLAVRRLEEAARGRSAHGETVPSVSLAVSVLKPAAMEYLIEKAAELGVSAIHPVLTARSVVRLSEERWKAKAERWRKIALASCKQCGQDRVPAISEVRPYAEFLGSLSKFDLILIPTLTLKGDILYSAVRRTKAKSILGLIGPEGDFSPEETEMAVQKGAKPVTLGPLVLRSETAGIYLLSVLNFYFREMGNDAIK